MGKKYFDHIVICLLGTNNQHHIKPMDIYGSLLACGPLGLLDNLILYLAWHNLYDTFTTTNDGLINVGQLLIS